RSYGDWSSDVCSSDLEKEPCLALSLKLEMPMIRQLLSRQEIQPAEAPSGTPGMATGETTVEFLGACCRLVDLLDTPQDIPFLSEIGRASCRERGTVVV